MTEKPDYDRLWDLIKNTRFCMCVQIQQADGQLRSRPLTTQNQSLDEGILYFFIPKDGDIAQNLQQDRRINLAYANVDKAETEDKDLCRRLNVDATQYLFDFSQAKKAQFIYISTDYVFVGQESFYDEDGKPNPLNVYGKTKYEGEKVVQDNGMIVRISFPYRAQFEKKKDFVRTLKWLMEQGKELKMVTDSLNTPTFIDDIAHSLKYLINNFSPEVFHLNGSDSFTPYEEALQIARIFSLDSNLVGKTTFDEFYKGKAARPRNTVMKSKKNTFHTMKGFEEGLISIKESLK